MTRLTASSRSPAGSAVFTSNLASATACGKFFGDKAKGFCNCDVACADPKYNDCCADYQPLCGALINGTCGKGQCTGVGKTADGKDAICSCDPKCSEAGNCCKGFDPKGCSTAPKGSCKDACGGQAKDGDCYCDDQCAEMGDCCADIATMCKDQPAGDAGGTVGTDASSCAPKCSAKNCGDGDGCGGKCTGPCPNGGLCSAAKACVTGGADAATTGGTDSAAADAGAKLDATADTGTGTAPTGTINNTPASSAGCTAGGTAGGSLGMAFGMLALMGALVLRRRQV